MKKNSTKKALLLSVLSLLLCVSMLIGTTYAWFTDTVTSASNIIKSGTLDVELTYADGKEDPATATFADASEGAIFNYELWEPGYTEVKHLGIANVGTLALKYQMRILANGVVSKLADVIDVYYIDEAEQITSRTQLKDADKLGTLSQVINNFGEKVFGVLLAGESKTITLALKMQESAGNEYQNLSIGTDFSVQLLATQYTYEEDSFDHLYDEDADFAAQEIPSALVSELSDLTITAQEWINTTPYELTLNAGYKFLPTETYEQALTSKFADAHADFYVYADKDVKAGTMELAGWYDAWCSMPGVDGNWIALDVPQDIPANTPIRLIADGMNDGKTNEGITVPYNAICQFGNDGKGFQCGLAAVKPEALAGTTITVELRLYETYSEEECKELFGVKSKNYETGEYTTVGKFTYTFPAAKVSTLAELSDALKSGATDIDAGGANLGDFYYDAKFTDGAVIKNAKFTYFYGGNVEGTVTFENCEFVSDHSYSANFDSGNGNIIFNNCLFDGWSSFGTAITNVEMNDCTFQKSYNYGILRFYQTAQLNNCTFADNFEGVDTNVTGCKVELTGCSDVAIHNNGSNAGIWVVDGVDISDTVTSW